jgi:hypothetical protein
MRIEKLTAASINTGYYAKCIEVSRRIRWEIERDVIRGRTFDFDKRFMPDGLSRVNRLEFLDEKEQRLLSQIQGRTYANMFGLVERFIGIKMLEISRDYWYGDQVALEALVRFTDEELKHQALFRRIEEMIAPGMPDGYEFAPTANGVAAKVLQASTWAVLALTCHIELFTQVHYRHSIEPDGELSALYQDVFLFHWREESQHAILDELEWAREDARLSDPERDKAVNDLIALIGAVDGIVQTQAAADANYFQRVCGRALDAAAIARVRDGLLDAYRWQYIVSGVQEARFNQILSSLTSSAQRDRIQSALKLLMH